ncbi:E3 ubiquitin-protein ligase znrf1 isoform X3 [Dunckerocampus dactyliophorus]|uniref:E3 ubiquitin-protein ligase znrf1 isoform X3 n=1 Tax=Dunckerocampus dactyliophorus TaxID=161453 RepID=UPI0024064D20|nr:E3 ubiquitin-protein ligase znrf1 isoform X3 [Dunckerocampus dactyliophorus]
MGKSPKTPNPKRSRPEDSPGGISPPGTDIKDILESIYKRLICLDGRLALVEVLHKEFQAIRESLEFSQNQIVSLVTENATLRESVKTLTDGVSQLVQENKTMKETILDLQARSMRDNLVFAGIPEKSEEDPEEAVRAFMAQQLKLPADAIQNITFHRVHRLGAKKPENRRPRPIVAKFEHFKQKEQVKGRGRELKGTDFSVNDQFPREILDRRRRLFPVRRKFIDEGCRAVITVDKLFVNGQLYRDQEVTPWLY